MKTKFSFAIVALVVVASTIAMVGVNSNIAFAKITPAQPPSCTNGGGNQPGGQQPTCTGGGLTQDPGSPATNPAGNEPPGQQP